MNYFILLLITLSLSISLVACNDEDTEILGEGLEIDLNSRNIKPNLETPNLASPADADDPAIWLHPTNRSRSLIIGTAKDAGLRVYNLSGELVQTISTDSVSSGKSRFNNVDVQYDFDLNGTKIDIAVASDRGQDVIKIWKINGNSNTPLTDITYANTPKAFPTKPTRNDYLNRAADTQNPFTDQRTAYGLTLYRDVSNNLHYVLVNQRQEPVIAQYLLVAQSNNTVSMQFVRDFRFPYTYKGQDLQQTSSTDARLDWSPQFEGMVVDQRSGILYAGQEDVGIWRVNLRTGVAESTPFYETRGSTASTFNNQNSRLARDVEGLTIFYAPNGKGYLLVSSQGGSPQNRTNEPYDNSFLIFTRATNELIGQFKLTANDSIDAVQECDGADIISTSLPNYPYGLFITQDGYNDDLNDFSGEVSASNFKYTSWETLANSFADGYLTKNGSFYDPRNPMQ